MGSNTKYSTMVKQYGTGVTYYKMLGATAMNFISDIEGTTTAIGHGGKPLLGR